LDRHYHLEEDESWTEIITNLENIQKSSCTICLNYQKEISANTVRYRDNDESVSFLISPK
jgi:hypothetical protein